LVDGSDLRDIADEVGLDLYNGRIEILCDETLRPTDPARDRVAPVRDAFDDIANIDAADLPTPHASVTFRSVVAITADIDATFETSVGVIHRIDEQTRSVVHAERGAPSVADSRVASLVTDNRHTTVSLEEGRFDDQFDVVDERRFGQTQTEYKEWAVDRLREHHTTTVTYTGDNNVTYNKTCEPRQSDISVQSIDPVYLPEVRQTTSLGEYSYPYEYHAAGPSRVTREDGIHACVHCETNGEDESYTYCENCGSVNCDGHVRTERLVDEPVCTGCAVTERFALATKYFYDEENLDEFREAYDAMPVYRKAMENPPLVAGSVVTTLLAVLGVLLATGVV
jgi:restriction endonuclease Mrr